MWWLWALLLLGGFYLVDFYLDRRRWKRWPTLEKYLTDYPKMRHDGVGCFKCGGKNITSHPAMKKDPACRLHRCETCSTWLYRNED